MNRAIIFTIMMSVTLPSWALEIKLPERELKKLPAVFIDVGACPFECCTYRSWKVEKKAVLYDKPNGSKIIGKLSKGESVEALTGEVHTKPILVSVIADHVDDSGNHFVAGDKFYVLTYLGEGFYRAWSSGKIFQMGAFGVIKLSQNTNDEPSWAEASELYNDTWWQKVKTKNGVVGWTKENAFSSQDACG